MALGKQISPEQVPAVTWHFQSTAQFISSASWEVKTRKFFPVLYVSPCRGLEMTKYREERKQLKQLGGRGGSVILQDLARTASPEAHLGHHNLIIPSSRCNPSCRGRWAGSRWFFRYTKTSSHWSWGALKPKPYSKINNELVNNALGVCSGENNINGGKPEVYQQTSTMNKSEEGCWVKIT